MSQKAFIYGATDLAQLLYANLLEAGNHTVDAFVVDEKYKTMDSMMGLPVVSSIELRESFPPKNYGCYICVGYTAMNTNRQKAFKTFHDAGYQILDFRHSTAVVRAAKLGAGNLFFANAFVDFFSKIGDGNIFYPGAAFAHHSCAGNFNFFAVNCCIAGHVWMGDKNFIGANATVINNLSIGDEVLVGAGACLTRDIGCGQVFVSPKGYALESRSSTDFL